MKEAEIDYKKLYEESLLTISEKEKNLEQAELVISKKEEKIESLSFELDKFRRYIFGKKSEKLSSLHTSEDQLDLFDLGTSQEQQEALSEQVAPQATEEVEKPKKPAKKATGRMKLPENLRREEIVLEPEEDVTGLKKIGEEVTEMLDVIPAEVIVKRYVRPKYAKADGEGVIIARLPDRIIEKGIPSERLVAQMSVEKYAYAMPLHRQIDKYSKMGVRIPASTASDWMMKSWNHLIPLWELLKLMVLNQNYLQVDESPIKVLQKNQKKGIHQGYMWVYHAPCDRLVLFDYRRGRDRSGPMAMLKDFKGIIQTDGYSVYESLYADHPDISLVYCMAHARRKFVDALGDNEKLANFFLQKVQMLYALEAQMREDGMKWTERTDHRKRHAMPILDELGEWLDEHNLKVRPTSPLGKAIAYAKTRWQGLSAYALHGQLEIDNNWVENSIRPLAIGRKNYLFAGSHDAAEVTAGMYSFMAMCKVNGINEVEWLTDVFEKIQSHKQKDLYQLLPSNWRKYRNSNS